MIPQNELSELLLTAKEAVKKAEKVIMPFYEGNIPYELKPDQSPVTEADKLAEQTIIEFISSRYPEHNFYGEETGATASENDFTWIIDPIDGTKNFIARIPLWGTLLALHHNNEIIVGVSYLPKMNEICYAAKGMGAYINDTKVHVSEVTQLDRAMVSFGTLKAFKEKNYYTNVSELIDSTHRQRSFGDLYPYHLLASGKLEIVIEAALKPYDIAPFFIIIPEAGGKVTDIDGNDFSYTVRTALATNGHVHNTAVRLFTK